MKSILIVAALIVIGGFIYFGLKATNKQANLPATNTQSTNPTDQPVSNSVKEFTIEAKPFEFNPKEIRVKKGNSVKITFVNNEGTHDFMIDGLNVKTKQIPAGQTDTVEFVANTAGTFEYYCSVGNGYHRQQGMVGSLVVEE